MAEMGNALEVSTVYRYHAGKYRCTATNQAHEFSKSEYREVLLTVNCKYTYYVFIFVSNLMFCNMKYNAATMYFFLELSSAGVIRFYSTFFGLSTI